MGLALIVVVLIVPLFGEAAHALVFLALAGGALVSPGLALQALALNWLALSLNPGVYSVSSATDVLRWVVIASAVISIWLRFFSPRLRISPTVIAVTVFSTFAVWSAAATSTAFDVSLFKAASFWVVAASVLLAFDSMRGDGDRWLEWWRVLCSVVVFAGLSLVATEAGYLRNGRGFQGLLNHPQVYSAFLGPVAAFALFDAASARVRRVRLWSLLLFAMALGSLFLSQGRTGLVAFAVGSASAGVIWLVRNGALRAWRVRPFALIAMLTVIGSLVVTSPQWFRLVETAVVDFVFKQSDASIGLDHAFYDSRGFLIRASLERYRESPVIGNGFGIPTNPGELQVRRVSPLGIPVGASSEKGFTLTAVLEEVGAIGLGLFAVMVYFVLLRVFRVRSRGVSRIALAVSALSVTFGEAVLFSVGGMGSLTWFMLGMSGVASGTRDPACVGSTGRRVDA